MNFLTSWGAVKPGFRQQSPIAKILCISLTIPNDWSGGCKVESTSRPGPISRRPFDCNHESCGRHNSDVWCKSSSNYRFAPTSVCNPRYGTQTFRKVRSESLHQLIKQRRARLPPTHDESGVKCHDNHRRCRNTIYRKIIHNVFNNHCRQNSSRSAIFNILKRKQIKWKRILNVKEKKWPKMYGYCIKRGICAVQK